MAQIRPKKNGKRVAQLPIGASFCSQPFPDQMRVTLRYTSIVDVATATFYTLAQWRANSAFDPDYTYTGVQPLGFDQWAAIYAQYRVEEAIVDLSVSCRDTAATVTAALYALPSAATTLDVQEASQLRRAVCGQTNNGAAPMRLRMRVPIHQLFGVSPQSVRDSIAYSALTSTNPTQTGYLTMIINGSKSATDISYEMKIKYRVCFWQPFLANDSVFLKQLRLRADGQRASPALGIRRLDATAPADGSPSTPGGCRSAAGGRPEWDDPSSRDVLPSRRISGVLPSSAGCPPCPVKAWDEKSPSCTGAEVVVPDCPCGLPTCRVRQV